MIISLEIVPCRPLFGQVDGLKFMGFIADHIWVRVLLIPNALGNIVAPPAVILFPGSISTRHVICTTVAAMNR